MLNSFNRIFDYSDYERKLRHYFTDSAPVRADITIGLREVRVSCRSGNSVSCEIDDTLPVSENIKKVIDACIGNIYPRMAFSEKAAAPFSDEQKKSFLMQGLSIEQIHEKERIRRRVYYTLVKFNEYDSTVDYIEEAAGTRFRAHLYRPLKLVKDKLWELAYDGKREHGGDGMEELYRFLMSISKQEAIKMKNAGGGECGTQEFL
jgi:hypothetical protein